MPARRRRVSDSSVETVIDHHVHWRQESSVLKSTPKDLNQDYWPTYELRDTVVLNKDGQTLENALYVAVRGPFIIRGTLIIDAPEQRSQLLMRVRTSVPIEIRQSIKYCIGMSEDNQPQIWVSGKAGWYEINPAPAYQSVYNKMCEATLLYYGLMDGCMQHKPSKPKAAKRTVALKDLYKVFHEASVSIGDGVVLEELLERCEEHAPFLISQAIEDDSRAGEPDKFRWAPTPFYKWMTAKYQNVLKNAQERFLNPPKPPRSPSADLKTPSATTSLPSRTRAGSSVSAVASRSRAKSSQENDTKVAATSPRRRSSRSHSISRKDADVPTPLASSQPSVSPVAASVTKSKGMASATKPKAPSPIIKDATEPTPTEKPQDATSPAPVVMNGQGQDAFTSVFDAIEWVHKEQASKKDGLIMSRVLNKLYFKYKFPNFRNGQVACHRIPVEEVLQYNAEALLRVLDKGKYESHELYSWLQEATKKEFHPISITQWPFSLVNRSVRTMAPRANRPVPEKSANSSPVDTGPESITIDDASSETSVEPSAHIGKTVRRPGKGPGRKSGLRLATASKKRPHAALESDSGSEEPGPKRSHYFSDGGEAMDTAEDANSAEEGDDQDQEVIQIILRADKMPSTTPKGPQETWVCDQVDCDYVVRGDGAEECKKRIYQHFQAHEAEMDRVNLAVTESRGHLPINHLLDKIKKLGEKAQMSERISINGVILPAPIKRKLIV